MQLTVKRVVREKGNAFSVIFTNPNNRFYPGQYIEIEDRCFSIASSPSEDFLMITVKSGITDFKKRLENIKVGDTVETSHPAGTFTINENDEAIFLAGGIGITPFRSMIKWALDQNFSLPMTLIYSNSDENFIYKDELKLWNQKLPNLTIHFIDTSKQDRLNKDGLLKLLPKSEAIYYLAGPPGMVDDFEKMLLEVGIDSTSIRTDRYDGY